MALVNNDNVPRWRHEKPLLVVLVRSAMDARYYAGIFEVGISLVPSNPDTKAEPEPVELCTDVSHESGRGKV